ncbi:MAG TPA: hypothetical protein VH024_16420 [Candidatus Angelobacter sp.]|nr:hypothetical protein [Candidatus Angelobacter sp.]
MDLKEDFTGIASQDWSKFDFTQWNVEGLKLDAQPAAITTWLRDATLSGQPAQAFARGVTVLKTAALKDLQVQARQLQQSISSADTELAVRTTATKNQIAALEEGLRAAALPPSATPDPASFQVGVKVVEQSARVGLPAMQVRVFDTKNPKATLATATTDLTGSAVLALNKEQTDALNKNNTEVGMEVLTQDGKTVFSGSQTVAPKLNQAGTLVASIPSSADLALHVQAGNAMTAQQKELADTLTSRLDALKTYYQTAKDEAQQQLELVKAMIAELQS